MCLLKRKSLSSAEFLGWGPRRQCTSVLGMELLTLGSLPTSCTVLSVPISHSHKRTYPSLNYTQQSWIPYFENSQQLLNWLMRWQEQSIYAHRTPNIAGEATACSKHLCTRNHIQHLPYPFWGSARKYEHKRLLCLVELMGQFLFVASSTSTPCVFLTRIWEWVSHAVVRLLYHTRVTPCRLSLWYECLWDNQIRFQFIQLIYLSKAMS